MTVTESAGHSERVDPWEGPLATLTDYLTTALSSRGVTVDVGLVRQQLDTSGSSGWDVAFAVHRFAKLLGRSAPDLARELGDHAPSVVGLQPPEPTGPYLNFRVDTKWLVETTLRLVLQQGRRFGQASPSGPPACVEHTSANPVGPFHIGRVRNSIIGDTLARVLRASGVPVTTQYYVDDVGRQSAMITWIWSKPYSVWPEEVRSQVSAPDVANDSIKPDHRYGRPYAFVSAYLKTHAEAGAEVAEISKKLESGELPPEHHRLGELILRGMMDSLARLDIRFDEFVWESSFLTDGSAHRIVERLRGAPHAHLEENGALAIDGTPYGLPMENARIIVTRGDGTTLYPTRDVAYHLQKFARFARVLDVLGQDHELHGKVLDALLAEIGEARRPELVFYQYITFEGGKMSTRAGRVVHLDDLLDEAVKRARSEVLTRREDLSGDEVEAIAEQVAAAAVRYLIVRTAPEKTVDFQWTEALSFEGRSGPFLQYAYARASSLLRRAGRTAGPYPFLTEQLQDPEELALVRLLSRLPSTITYAARTAHVHNLATYAHDLADQFNRFYQNVPVLKSVDPRESRIALVAALRHSLGSALDLLGIVALERM